MPREHLASLLDDCGRWGRTPALAHRAGLRPSSWSYDRVRSTAFRFARELEARGVGRGDRVLFLAESRPEWVVAFLGGMARGVVAVPLEPGSAPDFVERVREQVRPRLAVSDRPLAGFEHAARFRPRAARGRPLGRARRSPRPPPVVTSSTLSHLRHHRLQPKGVLLPDRRQRCPRATGGARGRAQQAHPCGSARLTRPWRAFSGASSLRPEPRLRPDLPPSSVPPAPGATNHFPPPLKMRSQTRGHDPAGARIGVAAAVRARCELELRPPRARTADQKARASLRRGRALPCPRPNPDSSLAPAVDGPRTRTAASALPPLAPATAGLRHLLPANSASCPRLARPPALVEGLRDDGATACSNINLASPLQGECRSLGGRLLPGTEASVSTSESAQRVTARGVSVLAWLLAHGRQPFTDRPSPAPAGPTTLFSGSGREPPLRGVGRIWIVTVSGLQP